MQSVMCQDTQCQIESEKAINLKKAWELSKSWKKAAIIWRTLEHIFVIGSFAASVSVVYVSAVYDDSRVANIILSSIAAILTLMSFSCNPIKYMTNYRGAFDSLNDALLSNTDKEGNFIGGENGWKEIIEAIKQGEKFIGKTFDFDTDVRLNRKEME